MLNSPPKVELQPREQILQEIRSQPKLKPVRERRIGKGRVPGAGRDEGWGGRGLGHKNVKELLIN